MSSATSKKRRTIQRKNLKKICRFNEEDRENAIIAVQQISELAKKNVLNNSTRSMAIDLNLPVVDNPSDGENSHSSNLSRERAIFRGSNRGSFEENENISIGAGSHDRSDLTSASPGPERPLGLFSGIRRRKKRHRNYAPYVAHETAPGTSLVSLPTGAWMCGVCAKRFHSYEDACRHEDYHIREIVADLGWAQTSLGPNYSSSGTMEMKRLANETAEEKYVSLGSESQRRRQEGQQNFVSSSSDQASNDHTVSSYGQEPITSRPDLLTVSSRTRVTPSAPSFPHNPHLSSYKDHELNTFGHVPEYQESPQDHHVNLMEKTLDDYIVLADEALVDVCCKAEKLALSQLEQEAEFELECYSKDKHYYDVLEKREIKRQRDGAYSRFRTEGKNFAEKIQNKFVDAYAVMKQGKSEKTTATVDHYKRKLEGDPDVQNIMDNTKQTMYVNVIVKNSIQVVSNELDRLARQRWEERQKNEGSEDVRNEESRAQFEKFKAAAQGQLVQLAGLALASDFTPRRIAVQLSNDLYRLLTPRLKRRGVFIESEIEYRVGPYFVLAMNVVDLDWTRLVKMTYKDAVDRRAKWIKTTESEDAKEGVTRRYGPLASLMRLFKMTSMEVLAGILAALYHTHWVIYTPICWFLYRFLIGELFRKYFLSSVTDEIFYYVEQKGMEMDIQIHGAGTQAACMLSALQEIRAGSRALKKKKEKAGSTEGQAVLLGPMLGPAIKADTKPAPPIPQNFQIPDNLEFVSLELNLQVGFQRLRWALLSSESSFMRDVVWKAELKYDNIEINEWNKFDDKIGLPDLGDGVKHEDFVGAQKEMSYLMPKSAFVAANMAHQTAFIETYNDYCFSLKLRALTPDVPYGSTFEAWTKYVVVNTGNNSCKLTCSVEAVFPNGPPMISRQIKSGMRDGVGHLFVKTGEALQRYANAYP